MNKTNLILVRNIIVTILCIYAAQIAIYLAAGLYLNFTPFYLPHFAIGAGVYHIFILGFLLASKNLLVIIPENKQLNHVNLTNIISLLRMCSLPTLQALILWSRKVPMTGLLLIFTALVFLTDLLDGWLSRKLNQVTLLGQALDSMSDYAVLIVVSVSFYIFKLIPDWFFWLTVSRMGIVVIGAVIMRFIRGRFQPDLSYMGKVSVFAIMTLYALEIAETLNLPFLSNSVFMITMEIIAGVLVGLSILDKIRLFGSRIISETSEKKRSES